MAKVSVLMPVYNVAPYLAEAISSILGQSFTDFEFIVIDDGSSDGSQEIVRSFNDPRLRFYQNEENIGVAASLNKGLALAKGEYIARMDGDDISAQKRLAAQVRLLDRKPGVGICGSWVRIRNDNGKGFINRYPLRAETIRAYIIFNNPVCHPVVMMRRATLDKYRLFYDENCVAAQDYELWSRCLEHTDFENLKDVLLTWRMNENGVTHTRFSKSNTVALQVQQRELQRLGVQAENDTLGFHRTIGNSTGLASIQELQQARQWLEMLLDQNRQTGRYLDEGFMRAAGMVWFYLCVNSSGLGVRVLREYLSVALSRNYLPPVEYFAYFLANSIFRLRKAPVGELMGSNGERQ